MLMKCQIPCHVLQDTSSQVHFKMELNLGGTVGTPLSGNMFGVNFCCVSVNSPPESSRHRLESTWVCVALPQPRVDARSPGNCLSSPHQFLSIAGQELPLWAVEGLSSRNEKAGNKKSASRGQRMGSLGELLVLESHWKSRDQPPSIRCL